jgi:hypothetical protein
MVRERFLSEQIQTKLSRLFPRIIRILRTFLSKNSMSKEKCTNVGLGDGYPVPVLYRKLYRFPIKTESAVKF